jgi:hypothetical protein
MSTSSDSTPISVVIGSNGAPGSVARCLEALAPQAAGVEIVVCEPEGSGQALRDAHPHVRFLERRGALVPELWRDGIDATSGAIVCLTISVMQPAYDWIATARSLAPEAAVTAGAIEPGEDLRLRDWAEYFCRYGRDMLPFEDRDSPDIPGDNAVYRREELETVHTTFRDGFWEPEVNRALHERGERLRQSPRLIAYQCRSSGFRSFLRQRLTHGRAYGGQRGRRFSTGRNLAAVPAAAVVPFVLLTRTTREVLSRGRLRMPFVLSLPVLFVYDVAWALGEAAGHVDSLRGR